MRGEKSGKGFIIFSLALCLLMVSAYAYGDDTECGCNQCHGNPPIVDTFGGKNGLAGVGFTAGAHLAHTHGTFGTAQNTVCYTCHFNGMPFTSICGNDMLQIGFNVNGTTGTGTTYHGTTLNAPWTYDGTNGTTINIDSSMTCSNVYCHSNGTGGTVNVAPSGPPPLNDTRPVAPSTSPSWTTVGPLACTTCHSYPPSYAQDQPKSNSHMFGQYAGDAHRQACNFCHYATTTDGVTIANTANHANGMYNVAPDPTATYLNNPVSFTYSYDPGGGRCSTISCHGGADYYWGRVSIVAPIVQNNGPACYEVQLQPNFSGGTAPYSCSWNLGDNTSAQGCSVDHTYLSAGPYAVTVTGRDANNHPYSQAAVITPHPVNMPPVANASLSVSCSTVTLTDLSTDPDYNTCGHSGNGTISINWGDGSTTTRNVALTGAPSNSVFTKAYASASVYQILQTVTDNASGISTNVITGVRVPATYTVGGQVTHPGGGLSGVTMVLKLNGITTKASATTDANGNYSFTPQGCGAYTVTATKTNYTFGPSNPQNVTIAGSNLTVNFTATP